MKGSLPLGGLALVPPARRWSRHQPPASRHRERRHLSQCLRTFTSLEPADFKGRPVGSERMICGFHEAGSTFMPVSAISNQTRRCGPNKLMNQPHQAHGTTSALALGALGIVFGDIGTSPLYTMKEVFGGHHLALSQGNVLGILSLIFWSLMLVVSVKYVSIMMRADKDRKS